MDFVKKIYLNIIIRNFKKNQTTTASNLIDPVHHGLNHIQFFQTFFDPIKTALDIVINPD